MATKLVDYTALERAHANVEYEPVRRSGPLALLALVLTTISTAQAAERPLIVATTASVKDSGLLDLLIPRFERLAGLSVKVVAAQPAGLFTLGKRGEADVLLVDSPPDGQGQLEQFVAAGQAGRVRAVMQSPLLVVGPSRDPAKIRGVGPAKAFAAIAKARAPFVSRGDRSGLHEVELEIWRRADITPRPSPWYREARKNMASALRLASDTKAYALTDRSAYLRLRDALALTVFVQGFKILQISYNLIEVNPASHPGVRAKEAQAFTNFMVSAEAQELIRTFGADKYGEPLFVPDAGP